MLSRLSRYFSRSKHRKDKYKPVNDTSLPVLPTKHPSYRPFEPPSRRNSASSGHSSSCSIEPERAPSFLELVCNDSQPVYCMETVPLYKPSSLPPGTRKANSLYDSAHDEILRERMRVSALENNNERERRRRRSRMSIRDGYGDSQGIQRYGSLQHTKAPSMRRLSSDRSGSIDSCYGPPAYPEKSRFRQSSQRQGPLERGYPPGRDYIPERDYIPRRDYVHERDHRPDRRTPTHPGPFRTPNTHGIPDNLNNRSIPAEPFFTRASSIRQGPYHIFQHPDLESAYHDPHRYEFQSVIDEGDIPLTRVTRLKEPARTFWRDDGVSSEIGVGLGRISGMAASRSVISRGNMKSDVGIPSPKRRFGEDISKTVNAPTPQRPRHFREEIPPVSYSTRVNPRTPPRGIKIGKPTGRYKTSTMPVYHLTTPDSDSESSGPQVDFISSSSLALAAVVDRDSVTDKWLDDVVKFTLPMEPEIPQRRNTLNVKRHRVFRTSLDSHSRETRPVTAKGEENVLCDENAVEEPSSWIAAEIFDIARAHASEMKVAESTVARLNGPTVNSKEVGRDNGYDDIESLIGDYFEDIKVAGSDCGED